MAMQTIGLLIDHLIETPDFLSDLENALWIACNVLNDVDFNPDEYFVAEE